MARDPARCNPSSGSPVWSASCWGHISRTGHCGTWSAFSTRILTSLPESSLSVYSTVPVPSISSPFAMPEIFVFCTFLISPVKSDSDGDMVHDAPLSKISVTSSGVIPYFR